MCFLRIFQIVLKVFLFPIWSILPSFSTSETSVINLEKFVYEARIDGYLNSVEYDLLRPAFSIIDDEENLSIIYFP